MSEKSLQGLREMLFAQLDELADKSKPIDVIRHRLRVQVSQAVIDSARLEVELSAVLKGALDVPFIEAQTQERLPAMAPTPSVPVTPMERAAQVLSGGPRSNHPWRPNGGSSE